MPSHLAIVIGAPCLAFYCQGNGNVRAGRDRLLKAEHIQPGIRQNRSWRRVDKHAGGKAEQKIAVRYDAREKGVCSGGFGIRMGIELVAGKIGKCLHIGSVNMARWRDKRLAKLQVAKAAAERMRRPLMSDAAGNPCLACSR